MDRRPANSFQQDKFDLVALSFFVFSQSLDDCPGVELDLDGQVQAGQQGSDPKGLCFRKQALAAGEFGGQD